MAQSAAVSRLALAVAVALTCAPLTAPRAQDDNTIRVTLATLPPRHGNPFATSATPSITTTSAIYDGLARFDKAGNLRPWLATAWRNVDEKTWRFELRRDVNFSNGAPFTAEAVVNAVTYMNTSVRPIDNLVRDLPAMISARALDSHTVEITTKDSVPSFPRHMPFLALPEPDAWRKLGPEEFAKQPVGTGPFVLQTWEPALASFAAFDGPGAWRKPKAARLEIRALPEATSRVQAILTGQADVAMQLGPDDLQTLEAAGHKGASWQDGGVTGISLVTTRNLPFNDVRVRRALNHAVNRAPLIATIMQGKTVAANQPAARMVYGHNAELPAYDYDPIKAKKLLAEAGYADGFSFVMETSTTSGAQLATFQQVAADLAAVGVKMEIRAMPGPQYLRNMFLTGEYADAVIVPWQTVPPIDVVRAVEIHSCDSKFPWYCDRDVMPLYQQALTEWDPAKALALRRELSRIYHEQAPAIFLYEQVIYAGLSARTHGFDDSFGLVAYDQISVNGN